MDSNKTARRPNINYILVINIILILNIIDLVLTFVGLRAGYFIEANAFLLYVYEKSPFVFVIIKVVIITAFYFICRFNIYKVSEFIRYLILIPLSVYSFVFLLHIITLISLPF